MYELCNSVNALYVDNYVILGDLNFNILNVNFNSKNTSDSIICPLRNLCRDFNLKNLIHEPTFYHRTGNSLLDVLVTNQCRRSPLLRPSKIELVMVTCSFSGPLRMKCPKQTPVDINLEVLRILIRIISLRICRVPPSLFPRFLMILGIPSGPLFINLLIFLMKMFRLRGNALEINNQPFLVLNLKKQL